MNLAGLLDFLINVVGLCIVVFLIFQALDLAAFGLDAGLKLIARYAVGGAALLAFLVYIAAVFTGRGGALMSATPASVIEFAIGLIVLIAVLYVINMVIDALAPAPLAAPVKFVISAIALIVILVLAEKALFGGGLGLIPNQLLGNIGGRPLPK